MARLIRRLARYRPFYRFPGRDDAAEGGGASNAGEAIGLLLALTKAS